MSASYYFKEPESTACFVCNHVMNKERPILYVAHDSDEGSWQFLCGFDDHSDDSARIISMKQATLIDPSINALHEMPEGIGAQRASINDRWEPFRL